MPSISKIRLTNVVYEQGQKRYHDEHFLFDGFNGAVILENGGGKTVFIQTVLQAIIPHTDVAERKVKDTLNLDEGPAHIAIEWILNENPRRYVVTAITLYKKQNGIDSLRYVYEYGENDSQSIEKIPFVQPTSQGLRPSDRGEISEYYSNMASQNSARAKIFNQSIKSFRQYIEEQYHIIGNEWESIVQINGTEGGIEAFFENCKKTNELIDRLLIPSVEKGIAGFKKDEFADLFENHRDQFKKYKELKEKIEQNKLLQSELAIYVDHYRNVDDKEQTYIQTRKHVKGFQQLLFSQLEQIGDKLKLLEESFLEWEKEKYTLGKKRVSLTIQKEINQQERLIEKEREIQTQLEDIERNLEKHQHEYYSLKFAELRDALKKENGNLEVYEVELAKLDGDVQVGNLNDELDQINGRLHYLFLDLKEQITKQIDDAKLEEIQLKTEENRQKEQLAHIGQDLQQWETQKTEAETSIKMYNKQMKDLKGQIVSHEDEVVDDLLAIWIDKEIKLDDEKVALVKTVKELTTLIQLEKEEDKLLQQEFRVKETSKAKLLEKINGFDQAHERVIKQLANTLPQWGYLQSVYDRKASIENQIIERLSKLEKRKEEALQNERLVKRFVDDYRDQDQFFADPYVAKQIMQWNQFSYLVTGISYLQTIRDSINWSMMDYPFWSLTLITTTKEKDSLIEKLQSIQHHLSYPIFVLTRDEAGNFAKGRKVAKEVIEPSIWQNHQHEERFSEWKEKIVQEASEKTGERKEVEKSLQIWEQTKHTFDHFIQNFSYDQYKALTTEMTELTHDIQSVHEKHKKLETRIHDLETDFRQKQEQQGNIETELMNLQQVKIPKAMEYVRLNKELKPLQEQQITYERFIEKSRQHLKLLKSQLEQTKQEIVAIHDAYQQLTSALKYEVDEHELFKAVKQARIIRNEATLDSLKVQRESLLDQLKQIQSTRGEWIAKRDYCNQHIEELEKSSTTLKNEYPTLDENTTFLMNGEDRIQTLFMRIQHLDSDLKEVRVHSNKAHTNRVVQESKTKDLIDQYTKTYPNEAIIEFSEELTIAEEHLQEVERKLQNRYDFLKQQKILEEKEQAACLSGKELFNKYELLHKLNDPNLDDKHLTEEEVGQFTYQRKRTIETLLKLLNEKQEDVEKEHSFLRLAKEQFKRFCMTVSDPRMRKTAIDGVENKSTYEEILQHQQLLEERIERIVQVAEATIQHYDEEQQQFITYIQTHLQKVRQDLLEIQKKTRVKVEDEWRTIFQIVVPDWDEDEGKEKIREYMEWILEQIENVQYMDENGIEDPAKVRLFLEKSLQTVPLFREIIGNQTIKVRCRKVESDQIVSKNYYSWEQSNQWSGGEKWSKNMTLFLGLLNFIAEKRQPIHSNAKRYRTVILDNPFGKASSDHVLSPIFFIAEQLGFQIIALTALAEGKFLSDYFPIIYSCRLRHAEGSSKQVMTKEKQIHIAYFHDHAPESLERLGEKEQLSFLLDE